MCDSHGKLELYMDELHQEIEDARKVIDALIMTIACRVDDTDCVAANRQLVENFYKRHGRDEK